MRRMGMDKVDTVKIAVAFATHVYREKALIGRKRTSILKSLWKN